MIEHGPDIKSQIENGLAKSDFAIAQLLYFNSHKKGTKNSRYSSDREPPSLVCKDKKAATDRRPVSAWHLHII